MGLSKKLNSSGIIAEGTFIIATSAFFNNAEPKSFVDAGVGAALQSPGSSLIDNSKYFFQEFQLYLYLMLGEYHQYLR